MNIEEAKAFLLECTAGDARIERSCFNEYVCANGVEYSDSILFEALEDLLEDRMIVQIPTPGQSRTTVSYRRSTQDEFAYFHHTVWPVSA